MILPLTDWGASHLQCNYNTAHLEFQFPSPWNRTLFCEWMAQTWINNAFHMPHIFTIQMSKDCILPWEKNRQDLLWICIWILLDLEYVMCVHFGNYSGMFHACKLIVFLWWTRGRSRTLWKTERLIIITQNFGTSAL